jgi:hypothetical protein
MTDDFGARSVVEAVQTGLSLAMELKNFGSILNFAVELDFYHSTTGDHRKRTQGKPLNSK